VLYPQSLDSFSSLGLPDVVSAAVSLTVLAIGFIIAFAAFSLYASRTASLASSSRVLSSIRAWVLEGLGFDRLYNYLYARVVKGLGNLSSRLQTGLLGWDTALVLATLVVLLFLVAGGVV
jgi:hypothetical protein